MTRYDDTAADHDPLDPSPSPAATRHRPTTRWAHPAPVRVGWIADAQRKYLESTGRLHVFGADGLKRVAARKAGASLMEAVDWIAARCNVMVYVADGDGTGGSRLYDLVRPVNPLPLSHEAGEDEGEALARRALDEGRAVIASGSGGGGFARSPACTSFLAAVAEEFERPVELLVGGFVRGDSLASGVDALLARRHQVTVVRDAMSFPARKAERRPPPGWAGDGTVASLADLRASWGMVRQTTFADLEIEEAHERMESLARRAPKFSSLHILDEAVPWELYRARLDAGRPTDTFRFGDAAWTDDALVAWKSLILGAIYEVSDHDLEFLILDRLSFRRFAGLRMTQRPPNVRMLKAHREHWNRTGVMAELVPDVDRRWRKEGYGLPGLERLAGSWPPVAESPDDGDLAKTGSPPGPRVVSKAGRGPKRRGGGRRKRKKKRKRRKRR